MKTDRELLELAAKAAGLPYTKPTEDYDGSLGLEVGDNPMRTRSWNPLTDDSDALRLAVKLKIRFEVHLRWPYVAAFAPNTIGRFEESKDDDPYAATRRAIVRAAAAIGEGMTQSLDNQLDT